MTAPFSIDNFRHVTEVHPRWGDMDALGHVNNAVYLTYLEQARVEYVLDLQLWDASASSLGFIMARVELDYLRPLTARDTVTIYTRTSRMGTKSMEMEQYITRLTARGIEPVAKSLITVVAMDYPNNITIPLPDEWRAKITDYEPGVVKVKE